MRWEIVVIETGRRGIESPLSCCEVGRPFVLMDVGKGGGFEG